MAASTAATVSGLTLPARLMTRETVMVDTSAARATSLMVAGRWLPLRAAFLLVTGHSLPRTLHCPAPAAKQPANHAFSPMTSQRDPACDRQAAPAPRWHWARGLP